MNFNKGEVLEGIAFIRDVASNVKIEQRLKQRLIRIDDVDVISREAAIVKHKPLKIKELESAMAKPIILPPQRNELQNWPEVGSSCRTITRGRCQAYANTTSGATKRHFLSIEKANRGKSQEKMARIAPRMSRAQPLRRSIILILSFYSTGNVTVS